MFHLVKKKPFDRSRREISSYVYKKKKYSRNQTSYVAKSALSQSLKQILRYTLFLARKIPRARILSLLLVSWQLARRPTIVSYREFCVGAWSVTGCARHVYTSLCTRVAASQTLEDHSSYAQHTHRRTYVRRWPSAYATARASYVTGTTSGRDVYVHALHAFLDRFLHREAPRGSGEHPKMERVPPIRNHAPFFSTRALCRRRCFIPFKADNGRYNDDKTEFIVILEQVSRRRKSLYGK